MASTRLPIRPLLVAAILAAGARAVPACGQTCAQPVYDERTAEGELFYDDEALGLVDIPDDALHWDVDPGTPMLGLPPVIVDGRLPLAWAVTVPAQPGTAGDVLGFRLDVSMRNAHLGETPLVATLCVCGAFQTPDEHGQCVPLGGSPSGPATCEDVSGTLMVNQNDLECEDDDPTLCAEQVDVRLRIPETAGKAFYGAIELRSIQSFEYGSCGGSGGSLGCNPPQGNLT